MISGIQSVLLPIFNFSDSILSMLLDGWKVIVSIVGYLKIAIDYAYDFIDWVPIQVKAVLFACFAIAVAYKIAGREG